MANGWRWRGTEIYGRKEERKCTVRLGWLARPKPWESLKKKNLEGRAAAANRVRE